jgi:NAD(P)-dependent dehydrogenase (short-subunit alcohol dehydrogenase family)
MPSTACPRSVDLRNKRTLVTGSTSGMGYAIARALAEAGAEVHLHGRSADGVRSALEQLRHECPSSVAHGHAYELADSDQVAALLRAVPDVDILVNNTGPTRSRSVLDIDPDEWQRYLNTYVTAGMLLGRAYLPKMSARGWGRVLYGAGVTCSFSPGDTDVAATMTAWLTSKAAMLGLARSLAEVAAGTGVTVNAFIPGPTHTEESFLAQASLPPGESFHDFEERFFAGQGMSSLLGRFIEPRELASAVVLLLSPEASAITGAVLRIDGGIIRTAV